MIIKFKIIYLFFLQKYKVYKSSKAFNRRYNQYDPILFSHNIDKNTIRKYKEKWSVLGAKVETNTFELSYNLSGIIDYNIVPENLFAAIIEQKLNPYIELSFFSIKNIYEKWFDMAMVFPISYFHKIDGVFYDKEFRIIEDINLFIVNSSFSFPLILKPSKDSYGGNGVTKVINKLDLLERLEDFEHFVVQELILQNRYLSTINDSSVNSVRSCLFRDKSGKFKILNNSMRFGVDGGLDNETAGGIVCNISDDGNLNNYAVNKFAKKFFEHPNSGIRFQDIIVPFYEDLNKLIVKISNQIPVCNLVSLDMTLDIDDNWRCIEINLSGQTIRFAQYAGKGFFGEYTSEVIERITK